MVKKIFKILLAIILLIVITIVWSIKGLDTTPYFKTEYYASTKKRLDSLSDQLHITKGKVYVGFGKQNITPQLFVQPENWQEGKFNNVPLAGFGGRKGKPAQGVHDSLYVKAVALKAGDKTLVFIGSDLLIMPPEVSKQVVELLSKQTQLKRENIFFSASHTHSSVGSWSAGVVGELFGGTYNPDMSRWLASKISLAIQQAVNDLKPGRLGTGSFMAKDYVRNRLVGELGKVDADFMFLQAIQENGRKAVLGSFNAHATTMGDKNMEFSADYPGYWQRKLESEGFDMAAFFGGSVGSHTSNGKGEGFDRPKYIGEALADSLMNYLPKIAMKDSLEMSSISLQLDLPEFHIRVSDGLRLRPIVARKLFPDVGDVYVQAARINDLIWATAPSDFSGETAIVFKNAMYRKGLKTMVTSFNGGYTGYIIPCEYYHMDAYEPRLMNWFGPSYNPFVNHMLDVIIEKISETK